MNWPAIPARVAAVGGRARAGVPRGAARPRSDPRAGSGSSRAPSRSRAATALAEFRRWNPWFRDLSDAELAPALVVGKPAECRERIAVAGRASSALEMPVLDLSGLDADRAREALEALPAGDIR